MNRVRRRFVLAGVGAISVVILALLLRSGSDDNGGRPGSLAPEGKGTPPTLVPPADKSALPSAPTTPGASPPHENFQRRVSWVRIPPWCRMISTFGFPGHSARGLTPGGVGARISGQAQNGMLTIEEETSLLRALDAVITLDGAILDHLTARPAEGAADRAVRPGADKAVGRLVSLLRGENSQELAALADSFRVRSKVVLDAVSQAVRVRMVIMLGEYPLDGAAEHLLRELGGSEDSEVRAAAALSLGKGTSDRTPLDQMRASSLDVQLLYLGGLKWGTVESEQIKELGEDFAFGRIGPRVNSPDLTAYLLTLAQTTPDVEIRLSALEALLPRVKEPAVFQYLANTLRTTQDQDQLSALLWDQSAFFFARDPTCADRLIQLSASNAPRVGLTATARLGASSEPRIVRYLLSRLEDKDPANVKAALGALWMNGAVLARETRSAVSLLKMRVQDPELRKAAGDVLDRISRIEGGSRIK